MFMRAAAGWLAETDTGIQLLHRLACSCYAL
jgi:hypothetical protein